MTLFYWVNAIRRTKKDPLQHFREGLFMFFSASSCLRAFVLRFSFPFPMQWGSG